jgi:hypothetical protein
MLIYRDGDIEKLKGIRYEFQPHVAVDEIRRLWQAAIADCEQRFGTYRVRREASHCLDGNEHVLFIGARTEVGRTLNTIFQKVTPEHWLRETTPIPSRRAAA